MNTAETTSYRLDDYSADGQFGNFIGFFTNIEDAESEIPVEFSQNQLGYEGQSHYHITAFKGLPSMGGWSNGEIVKDIHYVRI